MTILRKAGTAGLLVAASAAIAVSTAGTASAFPTPAGVYSSNEQCMLTGITLVRNGQAHVFKCEPAGQRKWRLDIYA